MTQWSVICDPVNNWYWPWPWMNEWNDVWLRISDMTLWNYQIIGKLIVCCLVFGDYIMRVPRCHAIHCLSTEYPHDWIVHETLFDIGTPNDMVNRMGKTSPFSHSIQSADPRSNGSMPWWRCIVPSESIVSWLYFFSPVLCSSAVTCAVSFEGLVATTVGGAKWHFLCWSICNCSLALDTGF